MTSNDVFRRVIGALEAAGVPYMLTGSFASAFHGAPRATQDIDLVVAPRPDQLRAFVSRLPADEYYVDEAAAMEAQSTEGQFNVIDLASGWKIDLIVRKSAHSAWLSLADESRQSSRGHRSSSPASKMY